MAGVRKVPQRTCVGCRTVRAKRELIRIVRTPEGSVEVDLTGKRSGRGMYICPSAACLDAAFTGRRLANALEVEVSSDVAAALRQALAEAVVARSS